MDFHNNLIFGNAASVLGVAVASPGPPIVANGAVNNTIASNEFAWISVAVGSPNVAPFMGNIVAENDGVWGVDAPDLVIEYSDAWGSATNWSDPVSKGATSIEVDPQFESGLTGDFHLQPDSPCVDAGNPDPAFNDADGTRNDMGAFGGPDGDWDPLEVL